MGEIRASRDKIEIQHPDSLAEARQRLIDDPPPDLLQALEDSINKARAARKAKMKWWAELGCGPEAKEGDDAE